MAARPPTARRGGAPSATREAARRLANEYAHPEEFTDKLEKALRLPPQPPCMNLADLSGSLRYVPGGHIITPNLHRGQRKLFLSELEFLTRWYRGEGVRPCDRQAEHPVVVYAGAAPSNHTYHLHTLFPEVKFVLVDPHRFDLFVGKMGNTHRAKKNRRIVHLKTAFPFSGYEAPESAQTAPAAYIRRSRARIFIYEDYFTDDLAAELAPLSPLFICDIRTSDSSDHRSGGVTNAHLLWNLAQQFVWVRLMRPRLSMLKFRHPFFDEKNVEDTVFHPYMARDFHTAARLGVDFKKDYRDGRFRYFDGEASLQCFPGYKSTETRLITAGTRLADLSSADYEGRLYFYNCVVRSYVFHENPHADPRLGFDHCNDCAKEARLWAAYRAVAADAPPVPALVAQLSAITKPLKGRDTAHGHLFRHPIPAEHLTKIYQERLAHYRSR